MPGYDRPGPLGEGPLTGGGSGGCGDPQRRLPMAEDVRRDPYSRGGGGRCRRRGARGRGGRGAARGPNPGLRRSRGAPDRAVLRED